MGVKSKGDGLELTLNNKKSLLVDFVIVAVGVEANTDLAKDSDLEVDPELGGFLVNTELQARTDLYIVSIISLHMPLNIYVSSVTAHLKDVPQGSYIEPLTMIVLHK